MIEKKGNKWIIKSESGKQLGEYDTEAEAQHRLRQIEFFKNKKPSQKSDRRIKQNIVDLAGSFEKINALLPRQFEFIDSPGYVYAGLIAQEFYEVFPDQTLVNGDNGTDPLGNNYPWQINTDELIYHVIQAFKILSSDFQGVEDSADQAAASASAAALSAASSETSSIASASSAATVVSQIASLGTKYEASLANVDAAASGSAKTVGTLSIPASGKYLVFAKCSVISQGLTLTMTQTEASVSQTTNTHENKNKVRESYGSLLGTSRNIAPNTYFIDVETTATLYLVLSVNYTGTAPQTVAADSEFYAVKIGNH